MKVLLLDKVEKLGRAGDVIEVKDGYARNFLFPRGLAVTATDKQLRSHRDMAMKVREKMDKEVQEMSAVAQKVDGKKLVIVKKTTKDGKLFGALTVKDVKEALKEIDLDVTDCVVDLSSVDKKLGEYQVIINWSQDINAVVAVEIVAEKKE